MLVPGCRGNYVPPGFKANLQPLTPLWDYWPLGPYQQKNKLSINQRPPTQGCQLMRRKPGSGEDPELQSTPKMPPTEEAGLPTELS